MSRTTVRGMHAIRCDWKPDTRTDPDYVGPGYCPAMFRSNSQLSVLADQLAHAGWHYERGSQTRPAKHLCPDHKPRPAGWNISGSIRPARSESG